MTEIQFTSEITVRKVQQCGGDHMIVAAAKVSTSGEEALKYAVPICPLHPPDSPDFGECIDNETVKANYGLIRYLMKSRHGCFDSETEVLTSSGWKRWPDVTGKELFVTLNLSTDEIEIQSASRVIHKRADGPMIHLKMAHVDSLVTPDHFMVAAPRRHNNQWEYGLYPAQEMLERCYRLRMGGGEWFGPINAPEEAALAGFAAADAHIGGSIEFGLKKHRKIKWLSERAELSVGSGGDRYRIKSPSAQLRRWCESTYTASRDRCLPREILEKGDSETIQALLDGYLMGDGSVSFTGRINCCTVSRQMVDDIQEAALKCGLVAVETAPDYSRSGSFGSRALYKLTIYRDRNSYPKIGWTQESRSEQVQIVDYHGDVHCVTVPNGTLYVRRNGKPMWCGNSPFEHGLLTVFVHAPIFVWREYHRHRIGHSFSEESARYKTLEPMFYLPPKDRPMFKVDDWKPGRPKFLPIINQVGEAAYDRLCKNLKESYEKAYRAYEQNLGLGIDPGLARDCLPVGIYSSSWVTVNPRSLMAFLSLRTHDMEAKYPSYPLYEIEVAARKLEVIFAEYWPLVHKAFCECGRVAP